MGKNECQNPQSVENLFCYLDQDMDIDCIPEEDRNVKISLWQRGKNFYCNIKNFQVTW